MREWPRGGLFIGGAARFRGRQGRSAAMPRAARARAGAAACGLGRHGAVSGGCKGWCGVRAGGRAARARAGRPGWLAVMCACNVFDRVSAGSSPATAGRGRVQELRGRLGVLLGSKGKLQDVVVQWLAAGLVKCPWWWPCPWHGCLGLGFRAWGCLGMSRRCVGFRVSWETRIEGKGSKGARFSTLVVFASFRSLLGIKLPHK